MVNFMLYIFYHNNKFINVRALFDIKCVRLVDEMKALRTK